MTRLFFDYLSGFVVILVNQIYNAVNKLCLFLSGRWSKDRYAPKSRPFNIQPFISDLLNNIAGIFKFPRPQKQKYDVGTIEPGQAQFIKDGASQAIMYR